MVNFYTADPHFGHEAILRFENRPFSSIEEMDETMLANLKKALGSRDTLYILGDFVWAKSHEEDRVRKLLRAIPGKKVLVTGNHDPHWVTHLPEWGAVHEMIEVKEDGQRLTLCHYPLITWPGVRYGALCAFGHVHGNWRGSRGCVNVGVDVFDFKPVTLFEIRKRSRELQVNPLLAKLEPGFIPD
jgi:calcineurin-like phosphoesterase family protein